MTEGGGFICQPRGTRNIAMSESMVVFLTFLILRPVFFALGHILSNLSPGQLPFIRCIEYQKGSTLGYSQNKQENPLDRRNPAAVDIHEILWSSIKSRVRFNLMVGSRWQPLQNEKHESVSMSHKKQVCGQAKTVYFTPGQNCVFHYFTIFFRNSNSR